MYRVTN